MPPNLPHLRRKTFSDEIFHFQVAANSGTSAIVTKNGDLYLFGKDSTQCDWSGQVIELKGQHVVQVALGKAHIVALTRDGDVYTFGMNNKGQCGRDFTAPRDPATALGIIPSRYLLYLLIFYDKLPSPVFRAKYSTLSVDEKF